MYKMMRKRMSKHGGASRAVEHGRARRGETGRRREPGRNNRHGVEPVAVGRGSRPEEKERGRERESVYG